MKDLTTNKEQKVSASGAAEELAHLALLAHERGDITIEVKAYRLVSRKGAKTAHGKYVKGKLRKVARESPKGLPNGSGVLALVDGETLIVQIVSREERAALKAHFRQTAPELTAAEAEVLRQGGASAAELKMGPAVWALARGSAELKYQALLDASLDVEQAARRLGVTSGRVRQLLGGRRLYGIKVGTDWQIPSFQFQGKRLVPGIEEVVPAMRPDLGLLAIHQWFTTPNADLRTEAEEDEGFTPLAWLRSGHPPKDAASLAAGL